MKKQYPLLLLLLMGMLLTACGQVGAGTSSKDKEKELENSNKVEEESDDKEMSEEEIKRILVKNLDAIDNVMLKLHEAHFYTDDHWEIQESILNPSLDDKETDRAIQKTKKLLEGLVEKKLLEKVVRLKLYDFFRHLEGASLRSSNIATRFEVMEQSEDYFKVSFLDLESDAGYTPAGTYIVEYEKKNNSWKLSDFDFINVDQKKLHLTYDDIKEAYESNGDKVHYVEEVTLADGTYIVVERNDFTFGVNKDNSMIDYGIDEHLTE
ncbi:MAG TPA: hypothetical protein VK125_05010 [Bacillota bacterium]|nr:hypothetical protein [Bacillota bacterium]